MAKFEPEEMKGFSIKDKYDREDYYVNEQGFVVFTERFHLKRGYCCTNGCKHCPYGNSPEDRKKKKSL